MERTAVDLWVGTFVVAGIAALVVLALKVGNLSTYNVSETYQLQAYFTNVGGLKPSASVRSAGVLVGRVTEIHFDNAKFQAVATLTLDNKYSFPKDSSASILTSGLLGEVYIGLDAGGDEKNLAAGDKIKITQSAVVLEKLIGQFLFSKASEGPEKK